MEFFAADVASHVAAYIIYYLAGRVAVLISGSKRALKVPFGVEGPCSSFFLHIAEIRPLLIAPYRVRLIWFSPHSRILPIEYRGYAPHRDIFISLRKSRYSDLPENISLSSTYVRSSAIGSFVTCGIHASRISGNCSRKKQWFAINFRRNLKIWRNRDQATGWSA